jgi:Putative prokaryotic signal transducing protein
MTESGGEATGWAPVATAPDQVTAEMWAELLQNNGIRAWVGRGDALASRLVPSGPAAVMVPASQLKEAKRILGPIGSPRRHYRRRK